MITIVGAGFAGVEAAWACATRGVPVRLYEMRPILTTPAHTTSNFAELVCSNSFKSKSPTSPAGQLKKEMLALGSLVLETAFEHEVPAGQALGVDRAAFSEAITEKVEAHRLIETRREPFTPEMAEQLVKDSSNLLVIATGPLTSPELAEWLARVTGRSHLYFYDAVSPTVETASIDLDIAFAQSRYDKGEGDDYLNCPFDRLRYEAFVEELKAAERAPIHAFESGGVRNTAPETLAGSPPDSMELESIAYFAGCMPIEEIARRGADSLRYGNFKPVGLFDPRTGKRPWAVLQLRPENNERTLYSLVACQTRLRWGEQNRVLRMVPGLESAEFVRYGVIHRNTYIEAPRVLANDLSLRSLPNVLLAGQLTGVEGYVESAAIGILGGMNACSRVGALPFTDPPRATAYGSLLSHLRDSTPRDFAPMNINWGILPDPPDPLKDKAARRSAKIEAANRSLEAWLSELRLAGSAAR